MAKEKNNEFTAKKIKKAIKAIIKKYPIEKDDSRIEKVYLRKKAISEYYEKNKSKIEDNVLVEIYNKMYNPSILIELSIGLFSGMLATWICDLLKAEIPKSSASPIANIIAGILIYLFILAMLLFALISAYKKILSLRTYIDEIDEYHREIVHNLIKEREAKYEKRDKNEPKSQKKNRKHK